MRVCRALLGQADAEDAWAETFVAALRSYPDLRPDSNIRGWLVTIAHRKALDSTRASARRAQPTADIADIADIASVSPVAHQPPERNPHLWAALDALPPKQRGAVVYHHIAGLPYADVGQILASSEAAARRSAADGIASLRKSLDRTSSTRTTATRTTRKEATP